jgi:septum formation protein
VAGILISAQGIGEAIQLLSTTTVAMRKLTQADIAQYIASGEHKDKAGSYGIQGLAATYISHINGSYSGVMGLPVYETAEMLRGFGLAI